MHLNVRLDTLDQGPTFALASGTSGLQDASKGAVSDLKNGIIRLIERMVLAGLLGTLVISALAFRSWRRVLICCGISVVTMAAGGAVAATTFRPQSIEEPTYTGLLANAPR